MTIQPRARGSRLRERKEFWLAMLFISPFTIGFLVFLLYPTLMSLYYSLTDYNLMSSPIFSGFKNYSLLWKDPVFGKSVLNTLYMTLLGVPLCNLAALLTAVLLNRRTPLNGLFRTLIYLPAVIPVVAVSLIWTWILNPDYGLLNAMLEAIGLTKHGWMSDAFYAKPALLMMSVWSMGNAMVMYLASLQDVPRELYESADIDGANAVSKFCYITIPGIKPVILYNVIVSIISFMQYFTQAYVANFTTQTVQLGLPLNSTMFYGTYLYQNAFSFFKLGYASAMAWLLFAATLVATLLLLKTSGMLKIEDD
ncbi:MAG: sugar ABC transporter permease [Eubacteriales bacterium]|nr:sugar ABC transporter permease [Eubacteriales bacterium]